MARRVASRHLGDAGPVGLLGSLKIVAIAGLTPRPIRTASCEAAVASACPSVDRVELADHREVARDHTVHRVAHAGDLAEPVGRREHQQDDDAEADEEAVTDRHKSLLDLSAGFDGQQLVHIEERDGLPLEEFGLKRAQSPSRRDGLASSARPRRR